MLPPEFPATVTAVMQRLNFFFFSTLTMYFNMVSGAPGKDFPMGDKDDPGRHNCRKWHTEDPNKRHSRSEKGKERERTSQLEHHCSREQQ